MATAPARIALTAAPFSVDWSPADDAVMPQEGEVFVFKVAIDTCPLSEAEIAAILPLTERMRAERLLAPGGARRFCVTRGALRMMLAALLARPPHRLAFKTAISGRPQLADGEGLDFNISHSGDLALIALTRTAAPCPAVGVDVEEYRPVGDMDTIAQRYFSPEDRQRFALAPPDRRDAEFFRGWVRLEAELKASGAGLAGLSRRRAVSATEWAVTDLALPETRCGYAAALAHRDEAVAIRHFRFLWPQAASRACRHMSLSSIEARP